MNLNQLRIRTLGLPALPNLTLLLNHIPFYELNKRAKQE
jgi:hypothetical protein